MRHRRKRIVSLENRFDGCTPSLEAKMDGRIGGFQSHSRADIVQVIGKMTDLGVRAARLEQER